MAPRELIKCCVGLTPSAHLLGFFCLRILSVFERPISLQMKYSLPPPFHIFWDSGSLLISQVFHLHLSWCQGSNFFVPQCLICWAFSFLFLNCVLHIDQANTWAHTLWSGPWNFYGIHCCPGLFLIFDHFFKYTCTLWSTWLYFINVLYWFVFVIFKTSKLRFVLSFLMSKEIYAIELCSQMLWHMELLLLHDQDLGFPT